MAEKIVVTGASGYLGSELVKRYVEAGFDVRGCDVLEPAKPVAGAKFAKVDLTDPAAVREFIAGADLVVHSASIHPWKKYTDAQYIDNNIKGTWELYAAARDCGISKILLTSSIAANGMAYIPPTDWPLREESRHRFWTIYCYTKHAQEDLAKHFAEMHKVQTLALRPPSFFPLPELEVGFNLLTGAYMVLSDVASVHVDAAMMMLGKREFGFPVKMFEPVYITVRVPYTTQDALEIGKTDRLLGRLVQKYWPKEYEWLVAHGFEGNITTIVFDSTKAERLLGWRAKYDFNCWFKDHGK